MSLRWASAAPGRSDAEFQVFFLDPANHRTTTKAAMRGSHGLHTPVLELHSPKLFCLQRPMSNIRLPVGQQKVAPLLRPTEYQAHTNGHHGIAPPLPIHRSSPSIFGYVVGWRAQPEGGAEADLRPDDVALSAGCNLAFVASIMSLADAGYEVILPIPCNQMLKGFRLPRSLTLLFSLQERPYVSLSPRPSQRRLSPLCRTLQRPQHLNPTGAIYTPDFILSFASLARENDVLVIIIGETYSDFIVGKHIVYLAIVFSRHLLSFSKNILDIIQTCAPRLIQLPLAPLLPSLQTFMSYPRDGKSVLKEAITYAFVKHPFATVGAADASRRLVEEKGVVGLPSAFFTQDTEGADPHLENGKVDWKTVERDTEVPETERWTPFSVANANDEKLRRVCERLGEPDSGLQLKG
ncbi:hypothetical protein CPB84DRAFT_1846427 [Gymnopilus junonius]|uniref:Uncharacterized protein n=1 Tax=Gymnopilus junonius TaxID=109634 RepID=A0A9P5NMF8_GYMJU|nr:hypothetical protein CPB84DRAFT_1846427 [Gymnopilus junonius]